MRKMGLGRGLDALLPDNEIESGSIRQIDITELDRNPSQPRREFDEEALQALADSMKEAGILQPLLVVEKDGRYQIVAGERRFRAARLAGLRQVPCIVRDMTAREQMEAALIENIQREDLNAMEEAAAVRKLMDDCGYTQEKVASRLGKSRPAVANLLRLLNLPKNVQALVVSGQLTAGHARVLAGLEDESRQTMLAEKTVQEGLSVRALEKLAADTPLPKTEKKPPRALPLELQDMEDRLQSVLGVRAAIQGNHKKGKITLQYYSEDELARIFESMEVLEGKK